MGIETRGGLKQGGIFSRNSPDGLWEKKRQELEAEDRQKAPGEREGTRNVERDVLDRMHLDLQQYTRVIGYFKVFHDVPISCPNWDIMAHVPIGTLQNL